MSSQFPPRGGFAESPLHELVIKLIRGRFSGSVEVLSDSAVRIFHFDNGNLCAATSDHAAEQIDTLLERTISPTLSRDQRRQVQERIQAGQPFARALVDLGVLHATELLAYNRNLAEEILRGALADHPHEYRASPGRPGKYNPVPFDPLVVVRNSILNELDEAKVNARLGDGSAVFAATGKMNGERGALADDPELKLVVSNLDGRKSTGEIAGRLGMNPDRSRRLLYFANLLGWIAPARRSLDRAADIAPGAGRAYGGQTARYSPYTREESDSEGILRLLEQQEQAISGHVTPPSGEPQTDTFRQEFSRQFNGGSERDDLLNSPATERNRKKRPLASSGFPALSMKFWIPAVGFIVILVVAFVMFSRQPESASDDKLSFYGDNVDQSQLGLDEDFTDHEDNNSSALKLPLRREQETPPAQREEPAPAEQQTGAVEEEEPPAESQPEGREEAAPQPSEPVRETTPRERYSFPDFATAHARALPIGHRGDWDTAAQIWRVGVEAERDRPFTLLVTTVDRRLFIADIFERFANSARLREGFFVLRGTGGYLVCWGLFADDASALDALRSLPASIRNLGPRLATFSSLPLAR